MDNQLLTGLVFIVVGVALGLLAYAIVLNRKERAALKTESTEAGEGREPEATLAAEADQATDRPAASEAALPSLPPAAPPGSFVSIVELMRDSRTGALIVRHAGREYRSAEELRAAAAWKQFESAAVDLQRWLAEAAEADRRRDSRRPQGLPPPRTMIDQINEILTRKLDAAGAEAPAVRLMDAGGGAVHVYIGLQRYEMDTVPDEEVRRLIREAVAEWEARQ